MLGWLVGATFASFAGAVIAVKIFDAVFGEANDAIRGAVFRLRMGNDHDSGKHG